MKYKIVYDSSAITVQDQVNDLLKAGWELYGSLCVSVAIGEFTQKYIYAQALIKKD